MTAVIKAGKYLPANLKNDTEAPNLFILKTIAAAQILSSPKLATLPSNPKKGEDIAKKLCSYFSSRMEDVRLRGERCFARQRMHEGDEPIPASIFNHTVLFFLHGFMKFENKFVRFLITDGTPLEERSLPMISADNVEEDDDDETVMSRNNSSSFDFNQADTIDQADFVEDPLDNLDSRAFII